MGALFARYDVEPASFSGSSHNNQVGYQAVEEKDSKADGEKKRPPRCVETTIPRQQALGTTLALVCDAGLGWAGICKATVVESIAKLLAY